MSKLKTIIKPITEELGKFAETAKSQVAPTDEKKSKDETREVVKHLYGAGERSEGARLLDKRGSDNKTTEIQKQEEAQKQKLRQELHAQYYQRLVNPPKPKEERPAEKVEKEKKQEMVDLQEKEKKKPPPIVQRAAQRVEKYPGASG